MLRFDFKNFWNKLKRSAFALIISGQFKMFCFCFDNKLRYLFVSIFNVDLDPAFNLNVDPDPGG